MSIKDPKIITPPEGLPVSIEQVRENSNIWTDGDEDLLDRVIRAAWQYAENFQQRTLLPTTFEMRIDHGFPCAIEIPKPPLIEVETIKYIDTDGVERTLDPAEYEVDIYSTPGVIVPAYNKCWPSVRCKRNAITVTYTAGYESIPEKTQTALVMLAGHYYENREAFSSEAFTFKEVPLGIQALLSLDRWSYYA